MDFYIDGKPTSEKYFWISLEGLIGPTQFVRLLNGAKINIGGVVYHIEEKHKENGEAGNR